MKSLLVLVFAFSSLSAPPLRAAEPAAPFGVEFPNLDSAAVGEWWTRPQRRDMPNLLVPRDEVVAFALYTHDRGVLKLTAQLGNKITMLAYANPGDVSDEKQRGDGYGLVRFNKSTRQITFECWPRFAQVANGDRAQFPGWPMTVAMEDNDGRTPAAWLPRLEFEGASRPVVQVIDERNGEILYTVRAGGPSFQPRVYAPGKYTIKIGRDRPEVEILTGFQATAKDRAGSRDVRL
jgi:hypothetical protein